MKKVVAVFLCMVLCICLVPPVGAVVARDLTPQTNLAEQLQQLGLFQGVGEKADGSTDFALDRAPTRVEAVVMLVRALGKGAEAEHQAKTHPFQDVPGWADGFVSYAYDQGYAKGVSKNKFGGNDTVTSEMYLTFMLRALGYTEGDRGEFGWNSPWGLAAWCGILPIQVDRNHFLRADVASVTCAALYAKRRGSESTLQERLVSEGAFTAEQFAEAFPSDPFAEFRRIDQKVTEAIVAQRPVGQIVYNKCLLENHMITSIVEANGELDITAMVCFGNATLEPDGTVSNYGVGSAPSRIVLDATTLELKSFQDTAELLDQWVPLENTAAYNKHYDLLNFGLNRTFFVQLQQLLDNGTVAYRSPTYEDAMKDLKNYSFYSEAKQWETEWCTIVLWYVSGAPHSGSMNLTLVYKKGSPLGEGVTVSLPLPDDTPVWGGTRSEPAEIRLSDDNSTLYYSYHYEEPIYGDFQTEWKRQHKAGSYQYTADLATGKAELKFIPNK